MGQVGSKTRSPGKIFRKHFVRSRGLIFGPIIMKLDQHVGRDVISHKFENGSCGVKNWVTRSNFGKHFVDSRSHIFSPIIMKFGQNVCLDEISDEFENGSCQVKN